MRFKYISVLTVLSTFAVVMLHVNNFWTFNSSNWGGYNVIESIFYFAVPIFIMISGATLIDYRKKYDTITFFKKRFLRVLVPYLVLSIIYVFTDFVFNNKGIDFKGFIEVILNGKAFGIFGFFILLFNLYLCIPFISLIPEEKRKDAFLYIIVLGIIFNSLLPFILKYLNIGYSNDWNIGLLGGYLLFAFIGYYINKYDIQKEIRLIIYLLGIFGLLTMTIGTYRRSIGLGSIDLFYKGYFNLCSILYATSIFTLFRYLENTKFISILDKGASKIAPYCFGVYLLHILYKRLFESNISVFQNRNIFMDFLFGIILFIISLITYYLVMLLIKYIKKLFVKKNIENN